LEEKVTPPGQSRSDVPPALESIILRLLEKNPKDRFASAHEVRSALERIELRSESELHGNLPQADFMERGSEVGQVIQLLEESQLVTLMNDDESLAYAVGRQLSDQFTDGVWVVHFESVDEPAMVLKTVASTLGACQVSERPLAVCLIEFLREKELLLILNRCGHISGACSQLTETILRGCPDVRILASSDKPLSAVNEKYYQPADSAGI